MGNSVRSIVIYLLNGAICPWHAVVRPSEKETKLYGSMNHGSKCNHQLSHSPTCS